MISTMPVFVAFLRAVNVGGTGKLAMSDLRGLCEAAGFQSVRTYIQSGNVVFGSALSQAKVKRKLEQALCTKLGKPCAVLLRSAAELAAVLRRNPFEKAAPRQVLVLFLDQTPARGALADLPIPGGEEVWLDGRELFVHFPNGMGRSKLKIPFAKTGTWRNLNTIAKLIAIVRTT
jgi:uncharacterized protein (DUF1697 family)